MHYALLYNPIAGRGAAARVAESIAGVIRGAGSNVVECRSERAGHIEEMARERGGKVDRLLVLGGDGSLREAAKGLLALAKGERAALGVLPFGSGNVIAREIDSGGAGPGPAAGLDPVRVAETMATCGVEPFDVGFARADGGAPEPFLAMAGAGYDASVAAGIARTRKGGFGARWYRWSADTLYAALGTREALRPGRRVRMRVVVDGATVADRAVAAIVSNVETYAKGMAMTPGAKANDGELDLHVRTSAMPWSTLAAHLFAFRRRAIPAWAATTSRGTRVQLAGESPFPWHLDGDAMGTCERLDLRVEHAALDMIGARKIAAVADAPASVGEEERDARRAGGPPDVAEAIL